MFESQQDWTWRRRLNLIVTAGFAVLALVLLFWRPETDWGRTLGHVSVGGVGVGIGLHLALFRRPRAIDPAQLRRIEATALRDARQVMLWAWAIAILWTGSWLMAGIDSELGLPVGGLLFVLSLPLLLFALPVFWRDLHGFRRDHRPARQPLREMGHDGARSTACPPKTGCRCGWPTWTSARPPACRTRCAR
jgi:hypothetical protein